MWVKICGIGDPRLATDLARLCPDALGFNFYEKSPRYVPVETAQAIVRSLPAAVEPVGLFVNSPIPRIRSICEQVGLRTIQLHGDESAEVLAQLQEFRLIKAFRVGDDGLGPVGEALQAYAQAGVVPWACLVDASVPGQFGGTGRQAPWAVLQHWDRSWPPLILAGGLDALNVREAIQTVSPQGVDVASGVETRPGIQSIEQAARFIHAARMSSPGNAPLVER